MEPKCLVCNGRTPSYLYKNHIKDVFSDSNVLPSKKKLLATLEEILDRTLDKQTCHSKILCLKCYKTCVEYDGYKSKVIVFKRIISEDFTKTVNNLDQLKNKDEKASNKIVVPASKLVPVPADFQLNFSSLSGFGQLANPLPNDQVANGGQVTITNVYDKTKATPLINLKVTIGSSVFTQSVKTSTVKIGKSLETIDSINSVMTAKEGGWSANLVPNEIFSNNDETNQNSDEDNSENGDDSDRSDEKVMKVVKDNSQKVNPASDENEMELDLENIKTEDPLTDDTQYINVSMQDDGSMVSADGNFVLGKLKIINEGEDGEQHTLILDGENGSILEMMAGQRLVYDNGQLQLVMNDDEENGDEQQDRDDGDAQDSNDESQIELQVSGDEETANAIIAAAHEKGGAFIKVESGEMYRVKSVVSTEDSEREVMSLVTKVGNSFRCKICQNTDEKLNVLMDAQTMTQHLKSKHDVKLNLCQFCGIGIKKRLDFTKHLGTHTKAQKSIIPPTNHRLYQCEMCQKGFNSRTLLLEHMNMHTGLRPYACSVCKKAFASKYTHQAHMKTHQSRPRPFKCRQCDKSFLSQQNLTQHEKTHLGLKPFKCEECGKAFGSMHNLEVHGVVHSGARPHVCSTCGKAFARRAELSDHARTHTGERPFACETCGARFAQRSNLHSHRRATHLHDKRHQCQQCNKRFKRRRLLEYHIKSSHTGERPLKCEVCGATFVYPEHYKKHARIHSGERPFYCEICGKSFNSRDNRNTHRFTHSDKKPYECLACGRSYMRKRQLIAHMNFSGHLAESIVVNQPRVTKVHNTENGVTTIVQINDGDVKKTEPNENESVFHTSSKLELLEEKTASLIKLPKDTSKLFANPIENASEESVLIRAVNSTQLDAETAQLTTSDSGAVLRLIQVQLPDGNDGWVALND